MNSFLERWANIPVRPPELKPAFPAEPQSGSPETDLGQAPTVNPAGKEPDAASSLKGQAVELWRDGSRFFLVADEEDAQEAIKRFGASRGEIWTSSELEFVAGIGEQSIREEIETLKRQTNGCLNDAGPKGIPWAEWKAAELNRLFREQGATGEPGRITAATVRHGERKTKGAEL
jgi:hypothetical protein